ncbi:glycoside hydrolase family 5 protein [Sphingomonas sp.]|jgi:endoglucanase|uniref:glycoside hydrolase family 5 protein n=1 Tax=Sphingomonas sp. TaxID=28214 RepID=UPI002ED7B1DC
MRRTARALVLLALLGASAPTPIIRRAAPQTAPAASIVARHGHLHVRGNRVVDAHGNPVTLRGNSLFWSQWQPAFYNRDAIAWLKRDWHAAAIRAAIAAASGGYIKDPAAETRRAEQVIDAAVAEGVYVLVDWHAHDPMPEEAIRFFTHIASRYRGVPNIIYETWNEPLPKYGWADVIKPYHARVIAAIRREDPGAFVVAGTRSWSQDVDEAAADPLPLSDVAYTLHYYAATHGAGLRAKADAAMRRGAALFVTEYGTTAADGDAPIDAAETRRWWDWCDANGISQMNWSIADKDEASAALRPGASPRGGWSPSALTTSGALVRTHMRTFPE